MTLRFLESLMAICMLSIFIFSSCIACSGTMRYSYSFRTPSDTRLYHSVVRIYTVQSAIPSNHGSSGTAWAFDTDHLMTAGHVCSIYTKYLASGHLIAGIQVFKSDGQSKQIDLGLATFVASIDTDEGIAEDMCILRLPNHGLWPLKISSDLSALRVEDDILTVGAPKHTFPVRRYGTIINTNSQNKRWLGTIKVALNVQSGSSGAPLMWRGEVIGLIVAVTGHSHNNNYLHNGGYAIRADMLRAFIDKHVD